MPTHPPILLPVFVLAAWTMGVLLLVAYRRVSSSIASRISPSEYALGESSKVPLPALLANRNYMNLLELPMLFYVGCLMALITHAETPGVLTAAWAYVALRCVHTLIHVSYNRVMHRFAAFALSNVALLLLWIQVGRQVLGGAVAG